MELISYSNKSGVVCNSIILCKHLGIQHQDLIRRIKRKTTVYLPHELIDDKFSRGGKRINYKLKTHIIKALELYEIEEEMKLLTGTPDFEPPSSSSGAEPS